jgi:hypothetical protein
MVLAEAEALVLLGTMETQVLVALAELDFLQPSVGLSSFMAVAAAVAFLINRLD